MDYLDFEAPIREIDEQIAKAQALQAESGVDMSESLAELNAKLAQVQAELKASIEVPNYSRWTGFQEYSKHY